MTVVGKASIASGNTWGGFFASEPGSILTVSLSRGSSVLEGLTCASMPRDCCAVGNQEQVALFAPPHRSHENARPSTMVERVPCQ
jgi:hypothetical protein